MRASPTLLAGLAVGFAAALPDSPDVDGHAYASCIAAAVGGNGSRYAFPTSPEYTTELNVYNLDHVYFPSAIAFPTCVAEVQKLVKCAHHAGIAVQALSGGHNYLNFGLGGQNGSLSIRLENLDQFHYNESTQSAQVQSGRLLGEVRRSLTAVNRRGIFSAISSIGTGGHLTIGGLGPGSRLNGLAADQILQVQVVLANGSVVLANDHEHPDLFFAVKGAAWSFGIVTEFWIKTHEPIEQIDYSYIIPGSFNQSAQLLAGWQALISQKNLSRAFGSTVYVYEGFSLISGNFLGTQSQFTQVGLGSLTSHAIPTAALLGALDKINLTATVDLVTKFEKVGLLSALPDLPSSAILELITGLQKLAPVLQSGNVSATLAAVEASNNAILNGLVAVLTADHDPTLLPSVFADLVQSGLLDIVTSPTDFPVVGAVLGNLNLTSVFGLISEAAQSPLLSALPRGSKFSAAFSALFFAHVPGHFYGKSLKFTDRNLLTASGIRQVYDYLARADRGTALWFVLFDLAGGAVNDPPATATAYVHRDALVWLQSYVVNLRGPVRPPSKDFLRNLHALVQNVTRPAVDDSAYAGYADDQLKFPQAAYWGDNLPTLQKIKARYDPTDVFRNPQSVAGVVLASRRAR